MDRFPHHETYLEPNTLHPARLPPSTRVGPSLEDAAREADAPLIVQEQVRPASVNALPWPVPLRVRRRSRSHPRFPVSVGVSLLLASPWTCHPNPFQGGYERIPTAVDAKNCEDIGYVYKDGCYVPAFPPARPSTSGRAD